MKKHYDYRHVNDDNRRIYQPSEVPPFSYIGVFLFLVLMLTSICAHSQIGSGRIEGIVIDYSDEEPLPGASIFIEGLEKGCASDKYGEFSFSDIPFGTYSLTIKFMGYHTAMEKITVNKENTKKIIIRLKAESKLLSEIVVLDKSEARKIREQSMPVTVLSASQLVGSVSDVSDILYKTMGVTIRSQGGVGSASRLSVRGLEGKRIGFFIDEAPMNDNADFIDINDIPVSMIERIEVYKGIVPAKFGGSAIGGAVNVVIKEYPPRYFDISYALESFNTHKATAVLKRNLPQAGIEFGAGGFYTYSDNDYVMDSPYHENLTIKRDHDKFDAFAGSINMKARKWYFDEWKFELEGIKNNKQLQGVFTNIRQAHSKSIAGVIGTEMKKKDFLIDGLDMDFDFAYAISQFRFIDTAMLRYNWNMEPYIPVHPMGGETGIAPSNTTIRKNIVGTKLNLEYIVNMQHAVNLNVLQTYAHGHPMDSLKDAALGYKTYYDSDMNSVVVGLCHEYKSLNDRFLNSLTGKYYFYSMETILRKFTSGHAEQPVNLKKHYWGISNASRYRFGEYLMGKISAAYEVRTPTESELIGDGYLIAPSGNLLPERGLNINIGAIWDKQTTNGILSFEMNLFGSYLKDMIRQTRNIIQVQYENFGEMRSLGIEAEVKADVLSWLYCYANVTYQDLRDTRKYEPISQVPNATYGLRLPNIPYFMVNAGVELHKQNLFGIKNTNTRFFTDVAFVEQYYYDFEMSIYQERRIPRSLRLDLGIEYSTMGGQLIFSGKMGNATNAKLFSEFNYPLPGRTFSLRVRYLLKSI